MQALVAPRLPGVRSSRGRGKDDLRSRASGVGPEHQAGPRAGRARMVHCGRAVHAGEMERSSPMAPDPGWCFGPYRLAGPQGPLWQQGQVVAVPPKPLAVLWTLASQAGQVVAKDVLLERGVARDGGE